MYREFRLKPIVPHDGELQFEWDPDTGLFRGRDAPKVKGMVDEAARIGSICGHPHPTIYDIVDPANDIAELAVVLGQFWVLDETLSAAYPDNVEDAPQGALH